MTRSDDSPTAKVKASIPAMVRRVTKENTRCGSITEFVISSRRLIWKAKATKHS